MVVRAYMGRLTLHLCEPRALPDVPEGLDFVSMTPAQFIALQEAGKPLKVKTLLLGVVHWLLGSIAPGIRGFI